MAEFSPNDQESSAIRHRKLRGNTNSPAEISHVTFSIKASARELDFLFQL